MSATASALQIEANRTNAQLSTGPTTAAGKLASSQNAISHGLTTRHPLIAGEDPAEFELHCQDYIDHHIPQNALDRAHVAELAELTWRLHRVGAFEADLFNLEIRNLTSDPDLKPLIQHCLSDSELLAVAFSRLIQNKVLTNLLALESRLSRRADKIDKRLEDTRYNREREAVKTKLRERNLQPQPTEIKEEIENPKNEANRPIRVPVQPGRNELCPCQSGLKYKRCCLDKPHAHNAGTTLPGEEL
jgi:SEC-C motif